METRNTHALVGIADYHSDFTMALGHRIVKQTELQIAFCCNNGEELLSAVARHHVDYLVVHLFLPFLSGAEAIQAIRAHNEEVFIIACSATYQKDMAEKFAALGNIAYCERNAFDICLFLTDKTLYQQQERYEKYINEWEATGQHRLAVQLLLQQKEKIIVGIVQLQVLALIVKGLTNKEIASVLNKSKRSIDSYIETMIHKLGVKSRVDLAFYAYDRGVCKVFCEMGHNGSCNKSSIFSPILNKIDLDKLP